MVWDQWTDRWVTALSACSRLGGEVSELAVAAPASESDVQAVERALQVQVPDSFREVLTSFSAEVSFRWWFPAKAPVHESVSGVSGGECCWSLHRLTDLADTYRQWIEVCFDNPGDNYDKVWHNKLAFHEVANGDMLALDLSLTPSPVVYLSHDDGEGHGYRLGADFADFIDRLTLLGCPGSEDWYMMPFIESPASYIDPDCENARVWRSALGLSFI